MKHALKGLIYSSLVYPGLGHVVLKRALRGLPFLFAATTGLGIIVVRSVRIALQITASYDPMSTPMDINQIITTTEQAMASIHTSSFNIPVMLLLISWFLGMIDAFFIGREMDRKQNEGPPLPDGF